MSRKFQVGYPCAACNAVHTHIVDNIDRAVEMARNILDAGGWSVSITDASIATQIELDQAEFEATDPATVLINQIRGLAGRK